LANRVRRSGRFIRGVAGTRRQSLWIDVVGSATTTTGGSGAVLTNSLNAAALALRPFTIIRSRGYIHIASDQAGAPENQAVAVAQCVVSDQASAIGVTAVPTPITDKGSDLFFMYQEVMAAGDSAAGAGMLGFGLEYDSRAMRKVNDDQDFIVVLESALAAMTDGVVTRHSGRILVKLH